MTACSANRAMRKEGIRLPSETDVQVSFERSPKGNRPNCGEGKASQNRDSN